MSEALQQPVAVPVEGEAREALSPTERPGESVRAVNRALDILLAFRGDRDGLSAAELLQRVDLSRPTLYRLLHTLEVKGFVESSGDPQRFRLGPSIAQLAHFWNSGLDLADAAEPAMRRLWEASSETVALFVPEGLMRMCLREFASPQPLSFRRGAGYRERLVLGASGRSILAYIENEIDLKVYVEGTNVDVERCRAELERVRQNGYAVSRDELIMGAVAIAAPIFGARRSVLGSVGIFGPSVRLGNEQVERLGALLVKETTDLSRALGKF
jgi:DNA-binding IclR family transcriptional regulator